MTNEGTFPGSTEFLARTYSDKDLRGLFTRVLNLEYSKRDDVKVNEVIEVIKFKMQEGLIEEIKEYELKELRNDLAYILALNYLTLKNNIETRGLDKMSLI